MSKAWDVIAYTVDGNIIHADCMEEYKAKETSEFVPVFQSDELDAALCVVCDEGV